MAYDDNSIYNKYQTSNSSSDDGCCGDSSEDCSCCPPGLVAIYDEDGKHEGCVSPNDAEEYKNGTHVPPEGYVKVYHPVTNEYLGDLSSVEAINMLNFLSNAVVPGSPLNNFNVNSPEVGATGYYELNYAASAGITADIELIIDRIGITDAITVSITGTAEDIEFYPNGQSVPIPSGSSELTTQIKWTGLSAGTYTFNLDFTYGVLSKQIPVRLTLT